MPKFTCIHPIEHDQKRHEVDSEISLSDEAAEPLLQLGHIAARAKPAGKPKPDARDQAAAHLQAAQAALAAEADEAKRPALQAAVDNAAAALAALG